MATNRTALRALSDPLRLRMLNLLGTRPMSAAEVAREIGITQALASYHLRKLLDVDLVKVERTRSNRGATEKVYELASAQELSLAFDDDGLLLLLEAVSTEMRRRAASADSTAPTLVTDSEVWATPAVIERTRTRLAEAVQDLIREASPAGDPDAVPVSATAILFRMTQGGSDGVHP